MTAVPVPVRVLTQNIHKGMSVGNARFVLHELKREIHATAADVVCLQEVQGQHRIRDRQLAEWPAESQFEFLADQAWPHHAYGRNAVYPHGHHGNAILSRFPIREWENINVSPYRRASRSILHAELDLGTGHLPLHVICAHFGLVEKERLTQTSTLVDRIQRIVPEEAPLIVAGDFNDWLGRCGRKLRQSLSLQDTFQAHTGSLARTFPAWLPALPVDRIYVRNAHILHARRGDQNWRQLSDHLPLICDLQIHPAQS